MCEGGDLCTAVGLPAETVPSCFKGASAMCLQDAMQAVHIPYALFLLYNAICLILQACRGVLSLWSLCMPVFIVRKFVACDLTDS